MFGTLRDLLAFAYKATEEMEKKAELFKEERREQMEAFRQKVEQAKEDIEERIRERKESCGYATREEVAELRDMLAALTEKVDKLAK